MRGDRKTMVVKALARGFMPEERKDTTPKTQEEDAKLPKAGLGGGGGEIAAVADQLAAVTLTDEEEAGPAGPGTPETQQVDELHHPLSDADLWKPHPPKEDCPVCLIPLPVEKEQMTYWPCCGKMICNACENENCRALRITNRKRGEKELPPLEESCAFCRETILQYASNKKERLEKMVDKGDAEGVTTMAYWCLVEGFQNNEAKAMELLEWAADMGSARAMHFLGLAYSMGKYGFPKDKKKAFGYLEDAVKIGDVSSRCVLATVYADEGNFQLAVKHLRLAAEAGHKTAVKQLWQLFSDGNMSKADLEEVLRAHQSACDEVDCEDRRRFDAFQEALEGNDDVLKDLYRAYYCGFINAKHLAEGLTMHRKGSGIEQIGKFLMACTSGKYDVVIHQERNIS